MVISDFDRHASIDNYDNYNLLLQFYNKSINAYQQELDNEHHILNINFGVVYSDNDRAEIAVYNVDTGDTQCFPLSVQGAGQAARYLIRAEITKYAEYGSSDNTVMGLRGNSNVNSIVKAAEEYVSSHVDLSLIHI